MSCSSPNQRREEPVLGRAGDSGIVPSTEFPDAIFSVLLLLRDLNGLDTTKVLDSSEFVEEVVTERVRAETSNLSTTESGLEITQ